MPITTVPAFEIGLKIIASLNLLYLAIQIAGGGSGAEGGRQTVDSARS